jgi:hypothetical protein
MYHTGKQIFSTFITNFPLNICFNLASFSCPVTVNEFSREKFPVFHKEKSQKILFLSILYKKRAKTVLTRTISAVVIQLRSPSVSFKDIWSLLRHRLLGHIGNEAEHGW